MAVTLTAGDIQHNGTWSSREALTQSTATAIQTLSNNHDVSVLGMGTATGFTRNRYLLSTSGAVEGMEKLVISSATGEAYLIFNSAAATGNHSFPLNVTAALLTTATTVDALMGIATATGNLVFNADGDYVLAKFINGYWRAQDLVGATLATST